MRFTRTTELTVLVLVATAPGLACGDDDPGPGVESSSTDGESSAAGDASDATGATGSATSTGGGACSEEGEPAPFSVEAMLDAHNQVRANANPTPDPPLPPFVWSDELASQASAWACTCDLNHDPDNPNGENIYASTAQELRAPTYVVDFWAEEAADYNYGSNTCSNVCGHYTQIVWRSTMEIGCAAQLCPDGLGGWEDSGPGQVWVCRYRPGGNFIGERPY